MKHNKIKCLLALATLIVIAGTFFIGWNLGNSKGFKDGYSWGFKDGTYHVINNADIWQDEDSY